MRFFWNNTAIGWGIAVMIEQCERKGLDVPQQQMNQFYVFGVLLKNIETLYRI